MPLWRKEAACCAEAMLTVLNVSDAECELLLCDDKAISVLNQRHLGLPGPTNVLSFPAEQGQGLGVIALSMEAVQREAMLYGQYPLEHFCRLLAHGLLHLLGFDHGPDMDGATEAMIEAGMANLASEA
ncbi:MAG: rRNA maturation RNase YbeY [Desulfovibrio sp.]|nr:MAG: rRNA maturation RNase YbeY [Desulfovibrio sp.]